MNNYCTHNFKLYNIMNYKCVLDTHYPRHCIFCAILFSQRTFCNHQYCLSFVPLLCSMPNAHSSIDDLICASFPATLLYLCPMIDAYSSIDCLLCIHPSLRHSLTFAPCFTHTPPRTMWFVQPSTLHRLTSAPCFIHTPPLTTLFVQPSTLHRLCSFFAPCLMQTPPLTALFEHPSLLHRFSCAPCLTHTPPLTA